MAEIKIIIKKGNTTTGMLDLGNKFNANAKNKNTVIWRLKSTSNVESITSILEKPFPLPDPSKNIWSIKPQPVAGSTDWKGTLKDNIPTDTNWNYNITWKDLNGNAPPTCDPKIIVNSSRE